MAVASGTSIADVESRYDGAGYGQFKEDVGEAVVALLGPLQEGYNALRADERELERLLALGAEKAAASAQPTLDVMYDRMGFVRRPRSAPAPEQQVQAPGHRDHERERHRIAQPPAQLGHVLEVHPIDRPDECRRKQDRRPGRDSLHLFVLPVPGLVERLGFERQVDVEDVPQQLVEPVQALVDAVAWSRTSRG